MPPPPPAIPDHTLLRPIGRGAYGEVWLARNVMGTLRAVKVIWRRQFESDRPYEREFAGIQSYEPVSRSSEGLVQVLHVGRNDAEGYFYYVMELADPGEPQLSNQCSVISNQSDKSALRTPMCLPVNTDDGLLTAAYTPRTLRSDLKRLGRLPTTDCLRLAIDVASGLAQLHRHGLVHRDVKPANIIYVSGRAKLADIGLVTAEGEGRTFVGTEGYIAPEGPGTPGADLYALGVVLYEASTGFAVERLPDVPREWLAEAAGDDALELHEVILKTSEGQRERRYADVEALQADLALLQSGQSVRRARALERRYWRLRATGMVGTTLLACALGTAVFANYRARLAAESHAKEVAMRQQVQRSLGRAEAAEQAARQQLYTALLEQARATVRSGELGQRVRALDAIRRASAISNSVELRGAALAAMALPDLRLEQQWPKAAATTHVEMDPDFLRVAICRGAGPAEIRSTIDQSLLATLPASTNLPAFIARWSRDGRFLAVKRDRTGSGGRADLEVWNVNTSRRILLFRDVDYGISAFHPSQPRVLAGQRNGTMGVWDLERGDELVRFEFPRPLMLLHFSPEGDRFAAVYQTDTGSVVSVHRAANGALVVKHELADFVAGLDWDPRRRWIATADHGGAVRLLDSETSESRVLGHHKVQAVLANFSPEGDYLLSAGWEQEFIFWDLRRLERAFTVGLNSFQAQIRADGGACAIVTDTDVQQYAFERSAGRREFSQTLGPRLLTAAFSPDGRWLAASASKQLGVWDLKSDPVGIVSNEGGDTRVSFSPEGELFATRDNACFRWRPRPGKNNLGPAVLEPLDLPQPEGLASLCLAANRIIFTGAKGSFIASLNEGGPKETNWAQTIDGISGASPDGRWLGIFAPYSRQLHIYRLPTLEEVSTLTNSSSIATFEFSSLGAEVAVSTHKGVEIWSTATWRRTRMLTNFVSLLYAPGARNYWLAKDYRTAGLYDAQTLQLLLPLPVGTRPMALSLDGRLMAASADATHLQVWDLDEVRRGLRELGLDW